MDRRGFIAGAGALALSACGTPNASRYASDEAVARAAYRDPGPTALTLFTMINRRSQAGAHSTLMISGSQRIIFDPAGSVRPDAIATRHDVLFGITPYIAEFYARAHARRSFYAVIQYHQVSPEVAEKALRLALAEPAAAQAYCTIKTSGLLRQLPGFESINVTWYPDKLADQFGTFPGTQTRTLIEDDDDDKSIAISRFDAQVAQGAQGAGQ